MAGWHHQLDGNEFEWTLGVGDGQGGLVCYDSWDHKESDMTERLNWTEYVARRIFLPSYLKIFFVIQEILLIHIYLREYFQKMLEFFYWNFIYFQTNSVYIDWYHFNIYLTQTLGMIYIDIGHCYHLRIKFKIFPERAYAIFIVLASR